MKYRKNGRSNAEIQSKIDRKLEKIGLDVDWKDITNYHTGKDFFIYPIYNDLNMSMGEVIETPKAFTVNIKAFK